MVSSCPQVGVTGAEWGAAAEKVSWEYQCPCLGSPRGTGSDISFFGLKASIAFLKEVCGRQQQVLSVEEQSGREAARLPSQAVGWVACESPSLLLGNKEHWKSGSQSWSTLQPTKWSGKPSRGAGVVHREGLGEAETKRDEVWGKLEQERSDSVTWECANVSWETGQFGKLLSAPQKLGGSLGLLVSSLVAQSRTAASCDFYSTLEQPRKWLGLGQALWSQA